MAEIIEKTGKSYNIFDKVNNVWNKISFWHKASDCEFNDGKTAQTKLGAIDGITSDLSGESETVAASIKCVNQLNSSLTNESAETFNFGILNGKRGFFTDSSRGADTFVPFSSIEKIELFNGEFLNTDIATIKHNATLSNGKIIGSSHTTGIWINNFNITNPENYVIVFEFTSTPSSPQIGYCSTTASLPTISSNGIGRLGYNTGSSYTSNYSCQLINGQGIYAGFEGTLEKVYLLKIK